LDEIAYIGDDLIDLPVLSVVGLRFAPNNAVSDVKTRVDHVSTINGGSGVLREIVEIVLKAQNKYDGFLAQYLV
jgi:3-deoxy-D-manno-octulosonate 8-phosphate phosphatase (KDO 8-P phosphatase)